jgi:hypothetical protein
MDPVFDGLLFTGPLVILCVVLLGRGPISEALVATYLAVLVARTAQKAL